MELGDAKITVKKPICDQIVSGLMNLYVHQVMFIYKHGFRGKGEHKQLRERCSFIHSTNYMRGSCPRHCPRCWERRGHKVVCPLGSVEGGTDNKQRAQKQEISQQ